MESQCFDKKCCLTMHSEGELSSILEKCVCSAIFFYYFFFLACPAGYFGWNCSNECNSPNYGIGCVERCECDPCHHVYGCNLTLTEFGKQSNLNYLIQIHCFSFKMHALVNRCLSFNMLTNHHCLMPFLFFFNLFLYSMSEVIVSIIFTVFNDITHKCRKSKLDHY